MVFTIKEANVILTFLSRVNLQGSEVDAFNAVIKLIKDNTDLTSNQPIEQKDDGKEDETAE